MLAKTPDPLDVMVGAKIRIFRTHCGMSQSDLAGKKRSASPFSKCRNTKRESTG
jgi:hypothetical protein